MALGHNLTSALESYIRIAEVWADILVEDQTVHMLDVWSLQGRVVSVTTTELYCYVIEHVHRGVNERNRLSRCSASSPQFANP